MKNVLFAKVVNFGFMLYFRYSLFVRKGVIVGRSFYFREFCPP